MQSFAPTRRLTPQLAALLLFAASLFLCTTLPAQPQPGPPDHMPPEVISDQPPNHPTSPPPATPQQQPTPAVTSSAPHSQPHRAAVTYAQGLLTITANDSSLNEILRDISRQTGMTITGGVADERVFGHYGPSTPGPVLATLLEGTSSNMLFIREQNGQPSQLILKVFSTGFALPSAIKSYIKDGSEKCFALWDPEELGYLATYATHLKLAGKLDVTPGTKFKAGKAGEYTVGDGGEIVYGKPLMFTKDNIDQFNF